MDKLAIIGTVVALTVAVATSAFLISCGSGSTGAVAAFQTRLVTARDAKGQAGTERLVEGTVRANTTTIAPSGQANVVAWAAWTQVRASAGSNVFRAEELSFGTAPFELETADGILLVDAKLRGASDLVRREQGPPGKVEITIAPGDHVTVLGQVSERDGKPGFFTDVIVVKGTFEQWHALIPQASVGSIPDQP
jgi:hypothetical protein